MDQPAPRLTPVQFARLKELFAQAQQRPPASRQAFVDEACADDPDVRRRLEHMLRNVDEGSSLPELEAALDEARDAALRGSAAEATTEHDLPSRIGPYLVRALLGEGGMGAVYEGEQTEPIRRRVAVKVVRPGLDTREVLARFESERQALALMEHPNIARVLDAGVTETGRPYFAMEYIDGFDIASYCDAERLTLRQRVELVLPVCAAIHSAHQKGVLHRDVKPSNVLVSLVDGKPVPKLIDFGIAKATAPDPKTIAARTLLGQPIGTLDYMSPEQAGLVALDVDTRADVYSLGALLYELLVGRPPLDLGRSDSLGELRRRMLDEPLVRPSTRVRTLPREIAGDAARARRLDPEALASQLAVDLDWIVLKALDRERDRRYGSAADLAADLARHLHDQPVLARPPSRRDRAVKFVRRHRLGVSLATLGAAALLLTTVVSLVAVVRIRASQHRAEEEAHRAQRVAEFLGDLFYEASPQRTHGAEVSAREMLDRGTEKLQGDLQDEPMVRAQLLGTVGEVYHTLGAYDVAETLLRQSIDAQDSLPLPDPTVRGQTLLALSWVHNSQGRPAEAVEEARQALALFERYPARDPADLAAALMLVGVAERNQGDLTAAESHLERALRLAEERPEGTVSLASVLYHLSWLHQQTGDLDRARQELERAIPLYESAEGQEAAVAWCLNDLAVLESRARHYERARELHLRALEIRRKVLGEDHPDVAATLNNLGSVELFLEGYEDAERSLESALDIRRRTLGGNHPLVGQTLYNLGLVADARHDRSRALERFSQALAVLEASKGEDSPDLLETLSQFAAYQARQGEMEAAKATAGRIRRILDKTASPSTNVLGTSLQALAEVALAAGDREQALELQHRAVEAYGRSFGEDDSRTAGARSREEQIRGGH